MTNLENKKNRTLVEKIENMNQLKSKMDPYIRTAEFNDVIVDRLIDRMKGENGEIAGSFPVQILLGDVYDSSDIDIFFKSKEIKEYNKFSTWIFEKFACCSSYNGSLYNHENIMSSRTYNVNEKLRLNVIYVNVENLEDHFTNFDLSFCRTIFDGNELRYLPDTLRKEGVINTVESFIGSYRFAFYKNLKPLNEESDSLTIKVYLNILSSRITKYENRGFVITNKEILSKYADISFI